MRRQAPLCAVGAGAAKRKIVEPYDAFAADAWSLGIVLYGIATGEAPFNMANVSDPFYAKFLRSREAPGATSLDAIEHVHNRRKTQNMDPVTHLYINALLVPHPLHRMVLATGPIW